MNCNVLLGRSTILAVIMSAAAQAAGPVGKGGRIVGDYSNSGCLEPPLRHEPSECDEDEIQLTVEGDTLHVLHRNASYNCCLDDIVISLAVEGKVLRLTEEEVLTHPCYCTCCYDVEATVVDLSPGEYTVEFCWFDYDTGQEECYVEDIVISDDASGPAIGEYSNSGCLGRSRGGYPWCGEDQIELTVEGGTLDVIHRNATYNCCPDDIVISLTVEGTWLRLTEEEILTMPCDCMCCYDVEATIVNLAPGEYTVEFCWFDYETGGEQCYTEDIVVSPPPD
jgi:hypothetical protein